jgi:phosphohistidine phosphatase
VKITQDIRCSQLSGGVSVDLYLIRHAEAKPLGEEETITDEERPLTDKGHAQAKLIAVGLQRHGVHLGLLLTSPLLRARQTAEGILSQWTASAPQLEVCEPLAPGKSPKKLARFLRSLETDSVGLVGHMPDLGTFLTRLIGSLKAQVHLSKGGVAFVACDGVRKGLGTLQWLVTPQWLG